jgi:integrase
VSTDPLGTFKGCRPLGHEWHGRYRLGNPRNHSSAPLAAHYLRHSYRRRVCARRGHRISNRGCEPLGLGTARNESRGARPRVNVGGAAQLFRSDPILPVRRVKSYSRSSALTPAIEQSAAPATSGRETGARGAVGYPAPKPKRRGEYTQSRGCHIRTNPQTQRSPGRNKLQGQKSQPSTRVLSCDPESLVRPLNREEIDVISHSRPLGLSEEPVPSLARGWGEDVEQYVEKRRNGISRRHALEIRRVANEAGRALANVGLACRPASFGDRHLDALLTGVWRPATAEQGGLAPRTRAYNVCLLNGVLKGHGNLTVENAHLHFPKSDVRRRDYLKPEAARRLLVAGENRGIEAHSIIAFEMLMGLRRCEVLRIRTVDLDLERNPDELVVRGSLKGQPGEKVRRVPWHDEVRRLIPELLAHREIVQSGCPGPDSGFVYVHRRETGLRVWSKSYVDRALMIPAFDDAGVKHPDGLNHVLRRTFGRTLYDNGVPLAKIAYLMGHSDTRVTERYLGIDRTDALDSMGVLNRVFPARKAV